MEVRLVDSTADAEKLIAYIARVSSPNPDNPEISGLIRYLIKHKHWSPFEMASATFEIHTTRAIAPQILRHRSFHFQEFSQRYAEVKDHYYEFSDARRQDTKNRQNSIDDLPEATKLEWLDRQYELATLAKMHYDWAIANHVAKECARGILPLNTKTKLYMKGTFRDWIHYINLRTANGTQKEHMDIANKIKDIFIANWPNLAEAAFINTCP